jgi:hypothetical protein
VSDADHEPSPTSRGTMARFWRRIIILLIIQTVVIVALVKLLPGAGS